MTLLASDLFSVAGKTALVTGATGYLGQVMVGVLKQNGAKVIGTYASRLPTSQLADEWYLIDANASSSESGERLFEIGTNNQIDILINNAHPMKREAGFNVDTDPIEHLSRA